MSEQLLSKFHKIQDAISSISKPPTVLDYEILVPTPEIWMYSDEGTWKNRTAGRNNNTSCDTTGAPDVFWRKDVVQVVHCFVSFSFYYKMAFDSNSLGPQAIELNQ